MRRYLSCSLGVLTLVSVTITLTPAADISWTNTAGGNWSQAANWNPNVLPGPADNVFITAVGVGVCTVTQDVSVAVASFSLGDGTMALTLTNVGHTLTISGPSAVRSHAVFGLGGGSLAGDGSLVIDGLGVWSEGQVALSTGVTVGQDGVLEITGPAAKVFGGTLSNQGLVRLTGAGALALCAGVIDNLPGGRFELENDQPIYLGGYCSPSLFRNGGLLLKSGGTGTNFFASVPLHNTGTVETRSGWIGIAGNSVFGTGTLFLGAGTNLLNQGNVWFDGTIVSSNAELAGATLSGTNTLHGALRWTSGNIDYSARVAVAENAELEITGPAAKVLGGTLSNEGLVRLTGAGALALCAGTIDNLPGGRFELENDQPIYLGGYCSPSLFRNAGLLLKSGGTGTNFFASVPLHNTGTVETRSGWIGIAGNSVFGTGTLFLGAGTNLLNQGNVCFDGTIVSSNAELAGATLSGTNTLHGALRWTSGNIDYSARVAVAENAELEITGPAAKVLGGTLSNEGLVRLTGAGALALCAGTIDNLPGGRFELENDQPIYLGGYCGASLFRNAGVLRKSGGGGTNLFASVPLLNAGLVELHSGTVAFDGGFTQTTGRTRLVGGNVASSQTLEFKGGILCGWGDIFASVNNHGELNPGQPFGILNIHGNYVHQGTLNIEIGGLDPGTSRDQLNVTGLALLRGALNICLAPGYLPQAGDAFEVVGFGARGGSFGSVSGLDLGGGRYLTPLYGPAGLALLTTNGPRNLYQLVFLPVGEGRYQLRFTCETNEVCCFEVSVHLTNDWVELYATNSSVGVIDYIDADAPHYPRRFYRAKAEK